MSRQRQAAAASASSASTEPAQHDVRQRVHVEPRRERLAEAAHGGLQARALVRDQVEPALRLGDACVAVPRQQQKQAVEREDQQHVAGCMRAAYANTKPSGATHASISQTSAVTRN